MKLSKKEIDHMAEFFNNLSQAQKNLEKMIVELVPDSYLKPVRHLNNAQIEVLKAFHSLLETRIEGLEYIDKEIEKKSKKKVVRKEKVEVE
jgi:hypothetical protein